MLKDRGYEITDQEAELEKLSDLEVGSRYLKIAKDNNCSMGLALSSSYKRSQTILLVLFMDNNYDEGKKREKMVSSDQVKSGIGLWKTNFSECDKCIFICPGKLSPDAKKEVSIPNLTVLLHEFLYFPIGRHVMVPPHKALSESEKKEFEEKRKICAAQLPELKSNDPVSLYYGFELGSIIRVSRPGWEVHRVIT